MSRTLLTRISAAALFLGIAWVAYTQNPAPAKLTLNKVKDDLYEIEGDGGNVAVYVTNEGVILIDDKFEQDHDGIMAKVKSVTNQPIKYIISTHHHADHSGGNAQVSADGARSSRPRTRGPTSWSTSSRNAPPGMTPGAGRVHRGDRGVSGRQGSARALLSAAATPMATRSSISRRCGPSTPAT